MGTALNTKGRTKHMAQTTTNYIKRFLYRISPDGKEVTISYDTQLFLTNPFWMVRDQMRDILLETGEDYVPYGGQWYPGIVYQLTISEEELRAALSAK